MAETQQPTLLPAAAGSPPRTPSRSAATLAPSVLPPAAAAAKAACGCEGSSTRAASAAAMPPAMSTAALTAPSLRPASAGAGAVAATWQSNVHFAGMWSINQDRNCWGYLDTVGWRNLSGASESGLVSLNMLATHAYQSNAIANCFEEDDGRISQIYVW
jgi:hypothetical protein